MQIKTLGLIYKQAKKNVSFSDDRASSVGPSGYFQRNMLARADTVIPDTILF